MLLTLVAVLCAVGSSIPFLIANASNPTSGTLAPTHGAQVAWVGTAPGGASESEGTCVDGVNCDVYELNVSGTPADWTNKRVKVEINWLLPANDYDMYIHKGAVDGPIIGSSAQGTTTNETVEFRPTEVGTGKFTVHVVYFAAVAADQYSGKASVPLATATPTPTPPLPAPPRFQNYAAPNGLGADAGEPTLGVNWQTGNVMFLAGLETLRVTFDDCTSPARATWVNKPGPNTSQQTFDPILFMDNDTGNGKQRTNRTFVSQLLPSKISLMAFTDDDGETYTPSQGAGINSGVDHQTVGGGPYHQPVPPRPPNVTYPNAVYYASQDIGTAELARSDDGGITFGPAVPMYNLTQCSGLHGHIKVAPDGTLYVPNKGCGGMQGVAVSEDNGTTFSIRTVPGSTAGDSDPSVGVSANGVVYFGYSDGEGRAKIAVSFDKGLTWVRDQDIGAQVNIKSTVFPAVVAGDDDRASFFFLGSEKPGGRDDDPIPNDANGNPDTTKAYDGVWYGYISTTYNGGQSWITVRTTPDPVQLGVVCTNGTTCPSGTRNLLDFNDNTMDARGRALAGFADGCVTDDCKNQRDRNGDGKINRFDNDGAQLATIIRQSGGKTLRAQFDSTTANNPPSPRTTATFDPQTNRVRLTWERPDTDIPITGYRIYRGTVGTAGDTLIATVDANTFTYEDANGTANSFYYVTAFNANAESAKCALVRPSVLENPCTLPGKTVSIDTSDNAPNVPPVPQVNIEKISIAEPGQADGVPRLVFTMKVADLSTVPPNSQWYIIWNRLNPDPNTTPPDPTATDRNYVAMKSDAAGNVRYEYGRITQPSANLPVRMGDADAGSFTADGQIRITIANSKIENPVAGRSIAGVLGRTFFNRPDGGPISQSASSDFSSEGNYTLTGNSTCAGTNNQTPTISVNDVVVTEGNTGTSTADFTVTLSNASASTVTVQFATANGTATAGSDYQSRTGTLTFAAGETSKTINVPIIGDTTAEADETFTLTLSNPTNATIARGQATGTIRNDDGAANTNSFQFAQGQYNILEAARFVDIVVNRTGNDLSGAANVDYATDDQLLLVGCDQPSNAVAYARCDYNTRSNTLRFAPGETSKTIRVFITDDAYVEGIERFTVVLRNPTGGATIGAASSAVVSIQDNDATQTNVNPADNSEFFVRQHYVDFLAREPEPSGLAAWLAVLARCGGGFAGSDPSCDRIEVSASFYRSPEFLQVKGFFVYRFYKVSFGEIPLYSDFIPDLQRVTGDSPSDDTPERAAERRNLFVQEWTQRARFQQRYGGKTNREYVELLIQTAGVQLANKEQLIADLDQNRKSRADVLREIVESNAVAAKEYPEAFVVMEYFGYLRRDGTNAEYNQWLPILRANPNDYRTMVNGFVNSTEYRKRFGTP